MERLISYTWPGNIRELSNAMERAVIMCTGNVIFPEDLPEDIVHTEELKRDLLGNKMVDGNGLTKKKGMRRGRDRR